MVTIKEIKSTIAVAIAAAFGFIIALIWKDIIIGMMQYAGLWQVGIPESWGQIGLATIVAVIITLVSVLGIVFISKWGGIAQK